MYVVPWPITVIRMYIVHGPLPSQFCRTVWPHEESLMRYSLVLCMEWGIKQNGNMEWGIEHGVGYWTWNGVLNIEWGNGVLNIEWDIAFISALPSQSSSQLYTLLVAPSRMPNSNNHRLFLHCSRDDMTFQSGDLSKWWPFFLHFLYCSSSLVQITIVAFM